MSTSPQKHDGDVQLCLIAGSGETQNNSTEQGASSCCYDKNHRTLAIWSIICGLSCIGCKALTNSVKAETTSDPERAVMFSQQAKKFGIISIVTWISILVLTLILLLLISYLLTLRD